MTVPDALTQNYYAVQKNIEDVRTQYNIRQNIQLIAVSKTFPAENIRHLFSLGQVDFGENYVQEFQAKATALSDLNIVWHYIGKIQSNKTKILAQHAHWVHGLDKASHALRLNKDRPSDMPKLNILIEVNISSSNNRHGVNTLNEILALAAVIDSQPNLVFRGLMGIAGNTPDAAVTNRQFQHLHSLFLQTQQLYPQIDTLSMGMSGDYHLAMQNGATMLRIGSLIFGHRPEK